METSTHDQKRPLLVQLIGDCLDLLIQRQHLLNQLWSSRKIKIVKIVVKKKLLDKERATEREHNKASCLRLIWPDWPGRILRPSMISSLLFCRDSLSSLIIRANMMRATNWLVYACVTRTRAGHESCCTSSHLEKLFHSETEPENLIWRRIRAQMKYETLHGI